MDGDALSVQDVNGEAPLTAFSVTSVGGNVGLAIFDTTGANNFAFDTAGGFEGLGAGEIDTVNLTYTVSDGNGGTDTANIAITITGENDDVVIDAGASDLSSDLTAGFVRADSLDANDLLALFSDVSRTATVVDEGGLDVLHISTGGQLRVPFIEIPVIAAGEIGADTRVTVLLDGVIQRVGGDQDMLFGVTDSDQHMSLFTTDGTIGGLFSDAILTGGSLGVAFPENPPANDRTLLGDSQIEDFIVQFVLEGTQDQTTLLEGDGSVLNLSGDPGLFLNNDDALSVVISGDQTFESYEVVSLAFSFDVDGLIDSGSIVFTDLDNGDTHTASVTNVATTGDNNGIAAATIAGFFTLGAVTSASGGTPGSVDWSFSADDSLFEYLGAGENLEIAYTVEVDDGQGSTDTETVTVTVNGRNEGPTASDDAFTMTESGFLTGDLLGNDSDVDGDALSVQDVNGEAPLTAFTVTSVGGRTGQAIFDTTGANNFAFDTAGGFEGLGAGETDTVNLTYTVSDGNGGTDTANIAITITGENDAPVAVDDVATVDEDSSVNIDVLGNDSDADGDSLTVTAASAANGTVVIETNGTLTYTPDADFNGADTISYAISDGNGGTDTAEVAVTVDAVNDAPVLSILALSDTSPVELSAVRNGDGGFVINGESAFDVAGYSVSGAGDMNGDGVADVIVGSRETSGIGKAYVVFGKADGTAVELTDVVAGNGGFVINGAESGDLAGISVSDAGDVNGDGLDDLIVGTGYTYYSNYAAGKSYVVFGQANPGTVNLAVVETGVGGFVIDGGGPYDYSGRAVSSAGDVNGDGLDDLLVGAYRADLGGGSTGAAYVVFGKANGLNVRLEDVEAGTGGFAINGVSVADETGLAVSDAGDVNGDGLADVIVAARSDDPNGSASGSAFVVFGKVGGATIELSQVEAGIGGFVINGAAAGDQAGSSVSSAGDLNGDGLTDLFVGARGVDQNGSNSGAGFVVFGKADGAAVELSNVAAGTGGFVINGVGGGDAAGGSVSNLGDLNGDGIGDLLIGASLDDPNGTQSGAAFVVFGKADGTAVELADIEAGTGGFVVNGALAGDVLGASVSGAGDINGDGIGDLILGAALSDPNGTQSGSAFVVFGKGLGGTITDFTQAPAFVADEDTPAVFDGLAILDVDATDVEAILSVSEGVLNVSASGATVTGDGTGSVTVTGALAEVNAAIGSVTYTPDADFNGTDSLDVTVSDLGNTGAGGALTDSESVQITVNPVNDNPDAVDDAFTMTESGFLTGDLLGNDSDVDGDALSVQDVNGEAPLTAFTVTSVGGRTGQAIFDTTGANNFAFDTAGAFEGLGAGETDTVNLTYTVSDGNGGTDTANIAITITGENDAPVAVDDVATVDEDSSVNIDVLGNDSDADGDSLTVTAASAANGQVDIEANGTLTYTPNADFNGADTISYTIDDGNGGTDTAEVAVTVNAVNDAPVLTPPVAGAVRFDGNTANHVEIAHDDGLNSASWTIEAWVTTLDDDAQFNRILTKPDGTGNQTYSMVVKDGEAFVFFGSAAGSQEVKAGFVADGQPHHIAGVYDDNADTLTLYVDGVVTDSITTTGTPLQGTEAIQIGQFSDNFASFGFNGDISEVRIWSEARTAADIAADLNGVLDPVAEDGLEVYMTFSQMLTGFDEGNLQGVNTVQDLSGNDRDGQISGFLPFIAGDAPVDSAIVTEVGQEVRFFDMSVLDVDAAEGTNQIQVVLESTDGTIDTQTFPGFTQIGDRTGQVTLIGDPVTLSDSLDNATFKPNAGFSGTATITVTATDLGNSGAGGPQTTAMTFTVEVIDPNAAPVAVDDTATVDEDNSVNIDVLANDSDPDANDVLTVTAASASNGTVVIEANGTLTYTPDADFNGADTISYTIDDGNGGTDTAEVAVTVNAVNDAPVLSRSDALQFDGGTSNFVSVANFNGFPSTAITVGFFARIDQLEPLDHFFSYAAPGGSDNEFLIRDADGLDAFGSFGGAAGGVGDFGDINDGAYHHIAVVWDNVSGAFRGYVDGVLAQSNIVAVGTSIVGNGTLVLGQDQDSVGGGFNGSQSLNGGMADLVISRRAFTDAEVADMANGIVDLTDADLAAAYSLAQNGGVIADLSGNGNDMTITGTMASTEGPGVARLGEQVDEDGTLVINGLSVSDIDLAEGTGEVEAVLSVTNGTLDVTDTGATIAGDGTGSVTVTGALSDVNAAIGSVTYTPDADFNGTDSLDVTVSDLGNTGAGGALTDSESVQITVNPVNDNPDAVDDAFTMTESGFLTGDLLGNDSDVDGDALSVQDVNGEAPLTAFTVTSVGGRTGQAIFDTTGANNFAFDTAGGFEGLGAGETDTVNLTYTVSDGNGGTDTANIAITITGENDAPVAVDDVATVDEDSSVNIDVLGNDSDDDTTDTLTVTSATASNGQVDIEANGTLTYTPDADFNGADTISYTIDDGNGGTATAEVAVTVNAVNDAPVIDDQASEVTGSVTEDGIVAVLSLSPSDLQAFVIPQATFGSSIQIRSGTEVLFIDNNSSPDGEAFIEIPLVGSGLLVSDTEVALSADVRRVLVDETGQNQDSATSAGLRDANHVLGVTMRAAQELGFGGPGSFELPAISARPDSGNVNPFAFINTPVGPLSQGQTVINGFARTIFNVTLDGGNDTSFLALGTVDGGNLQSFNVGLTPANYLDPEEGLSFVIAEDGQHFIAGVDLSFLASDVVTGGRIVFADDAGDSHTVSITDVRITGDAGTVDAVAAEAMLDIVISGNEAVWRFEGQLGLFDHLAAGEILEFAYDLDIIDAAGLSDSTTVIVTIDGRNDAPVAADDAATTDEDTPINIDVLSNDSDVDATDVLAVSSASAPNGSVTIENDGTLTYTPDADFNGVDTITYTVSDGNGGSDTAAITVTVNPLNDAPEIIVGGTGAVRFNGNNANFLGIAPDTALAPTSWTVEAWFSTTADSGVGRIVTSGGAGAVPYSIGVQNGEAIVLFDTSNGFGTIFLGSGVQVADGQPHHIAGVFSEADGLVSIYVDGQLAGDLTTGGLPVSGVLSFVDVGRAFFGQAFDGDISDVRVWSEARTDAQIAATFDQTLDPGAETELQLYLTLEESTFGNGVFSDLSGNGHLAVVNGSAERVDGAAPVDPQTVTDLGTLPAITVDEDETVTIAIGGLQVTDVDVNDGTGEVEVTLSVANGVIEVIPPTLTDNLVQFTGNGADFLQTQAEAVLDAAEWTIEATVITTSSSGTGRILTGSQPGGVPYSIGVQNGEPFVIFDSANGFGTVQLNAGVSIADGQPHHVAGVFSQADGLVSIYIDGQLAGSLATGALPVSGNPTVVEIGRAFFGQALIGDVADVRFWSEARTAAEIAADFDQELDPAAEGTLELYLTFEAGDIAGGVVQDQSSNGLGLTVNGSPTFVDAGVAVSGNGTGSVTISGDLALVNATLAAIDYTPDANFSGSDALQIDVSDLGNTGAGGPLTDTESIAITVNKVGPDLTNDLGFTGTENVPVFMDVLANDTGNDLRIVSAEASSGAAVTFTGAIGDGLTLDPSGGNVAGLSFGRTLSYDGLAPGDTIADIITFVVEDADGNQAGDAVVTRKTLDLSTIGTTTVASLDLDGVTVTGSTNVQALNFNGLGIQGGPFTARLDAGETMNLDFDHLAANVIFQVSTVNNTTGIDGVQVAVEGFDADGVSLGTQIVTAQFTEIGGHISAAFGDAPLSRVEITGQGDAFIMRTLNFDEIQGDGFAIVSVSGVNDAPVITDQTFSAAEDSFGIFETLDLDDPDRNHSEFDLTLNVVSAPAGTTVNLDFGELDFRLNGQFQDVSQGEVRDVEIVYTATDPDGAVSDPGTITVQISGNNDPVTGNDDTATVDEDSSVLIDAAANDTDIDALDTPTVQSVGAASNGTTAIEGGQIRYTPDADFFGNDSFTYVVTDGNGSTDIATVNVTIDPVNDAPTITGPSPVSGPLELDDVEAGIGGFSLHDTTVNSVEIFQDATERFFGETVSFAGDVNGDGLADFIVGDDNLNTINGNYSGGAAVVFGKADTASIDLSQIDAGVGGFRIFGASAQDDAGGAVSGGGDINGDGLADLIIGAQRNDDDGLLTGKAYVVFGKADGTAVDLLDVQSGTGGFVIEGGDIRDLVGRAVSNAGDINGDGLDDMIIGAPYAYDDAIRDPGTAYVVFGKASTTAVDLDDIRAGIGGFVVNGVLDNDLAGRSVSGGADINGDGLDDLVIGAPNYDIGYTTTSDTFVVFGKADGATVELADVQNGIGGFAINGVQLDDNFGQFVDVAGDFNGDGLADVIVSAPTDSNPSASKETHIIFGKADGSAVSMADVTAGIGGITIIADEGASAVSAAGDVNQDGLDDVIILSGAPGDSNGRAVVVFGRTDTANISLTDAANGIGGFAIDGVSDFGARILDIDGGFDVNGDGRPDFLAGTVGGGAPTPSSVHVVFGRGFETDEETPLTLTGTAMADIDAGSNDVEAVLSVTNGTVDVTNTGAIISGDGTGSVTVTGALADVNAATDSVIYTPDADFNGTDTLQIDVSDLGNSGSGGPLTASHAVEITVNPVDDRQTVSGTVDAGTVTEDNAPVTIDLLANASDVDGDDLDVQDVTVSSSNAARVVAFTVDSETGQLDIDPGQFSDLGDGESETITVDYAVSDDSVDFTDSIGSPNVPNGGVTYVVDFDTGNTFTFVRSSGPFLPAAQEPTNGAYVHVNPNNGFGGGVIARSFLDGVETARDASEIAFGNYGGTVSGASFSGAFSNSTITWTAHALETADGERCVSIRLDNVSHFTDDGLTVSSANFDVTTDVAAQATLEVTGITKLVFTAGNDTVDLNNVVAADADDGNVSNAGDGNDTVTLANNATEAAEAGFIVGETFFGGAGDDTIAGGGLDDVIDGGDGGDFISGGEGADLLIGGTGLNILNGGAGDDTLISSAGSSLDALNGGAGNDSLVAVETVFMSGGGGNDTLTAGSGGGNLSGDGGDDVLTGGDGSSTDLFGGAGNDLLTAGAAGANMSGGNQDDTLIGGAAGDDITGGNGADLLFGGGGLDVASGGDGDDTVEGGAGGDILSGGGGTDDLSYAGSGSAVTVDLGSGAASGGHASGDSFSGFENLVGSSHSDNLTGDGGANRIVGGSGADTINGGTGDDILTGDDGEPVTIDFSGGVFSYATGSNVFFDNGARLVHVADVSTDLVSDLRLTVADDGDLSVLNSGDLLSFSFTDEDGDTVSVADAVIGQSAFAANADEGVLTAIGTAAGGRADGGQIALLIAMDAPFGSGGVPAGSQFIADDADADADFGLPTSVELTALSASDALDGGEGDDTLEGGADGDDLSGGEGADTINGGTGNDTMDGGAGNDRFVFGTGDGDDQITGFQAGASTDDILDFSNAAGVTSTGDLTIGDDGSGNALIEYGSGDSVTLLGVNFNDLDSSDFQF